MINLKVYYRAISVLSILLFSNISSATEPAAKSDLKNEYNAILRAAFESLQNGSPKEAYELTAGLDALCKKAPEFESEKACSPDHLSKIRTDFQYEVTYQAASDHVAAGEYSEATKILEGVQPGCVLLHADKCIEQHDWLVRTAHLMIVREEVNRLVNLDEFKEAYSVLKRAEPLASALSEKDLNDFYWELAVIQGFYSPYEAVETVRERVRAKKFRSSLPFHNYLSYLGWLVNARQPQEVATELVRFFEECSLQGGMINALAPDTKEEALQSLDILLLSIIDMDADREDLTQAIIDASKLSHGEVKSLLLTRAGDLALSKADKSRLASTLYQASGMSETEKKRRINLSKHSLQTLADSKAEPESNSTLESQIESVVEITSGGKVPVDELRKIAEKWESMSADEIERNLVAYANASIILSEYAQPKEFKIQILSDSFSKIGEHISALESKYKNDNLVFDNAKKVDLLLYERLLWYAVYRSRVLDLYNDYERLSREQLRVNEALYGVQSYRLLSSLSSVADAYRSLGDRDSFKKTFFRAKSIESKNLSDYGKCNKPLYRFRYSFDYARNALDKLEIEKWFLSVGNIHLENANKFVGIEEKYNCVEEARDLVTEYIYLTNGDVGNLATVYELSQMADISDLLISTELGMEKLRTQNPDILKELLAFSHISKELNAPDADGTPSLENFLEYRKRRHEIYERMRSDAPEAASLMIASGLSLSETQKHLSDGEALVYYIENPDTTFTNSDQDTKPIEPSKPALMLFVVKKKAVHLIPLSAHSSQNVPASYRRVKDSLDQGVSRVSNLSPFDIESARELFDTLVSKAIPLIGDAHRLYIVPSPMLAGIPFELLPISQALPSVKNFVDFRKYRDVQWMNDRYSISYLSSPRMLGRRKIAASVDDSDFLGVGNPELSPVADSAPTSVKYSALSHFSDSIEQLLANDYKALSAAGSNATGLPESQLIVDSMARPYGKRATILTGGLATESQLSGLDLSKYSTITFATHGILGTDLIPEPALVLGRETDESEYDGLLTVREIERMQLGAKMVFLAACNSATKDRVNGVNSLANSFLTAGAASVIASSWAVDVTATAQLFDAYVRHQEMTPELSSAVLLQNARMDILRKSKNQLFAHPAFWGGFATYGF